MNLFTDDDLTDPMKADEDDGVAVLGFVAAALSGAVVTVLLVLFVL